MTNGGRGVMVVDSPTSLEAAVLADPEQLANGQWVLQVRGGGAPHQLSDPSMPRGPFGSSFTQGSLSAPCRRVPLTDVAATHCASGTWPTQCWSTDGSSTSGSTSSL